MKKWKVLLGTLALSLGLLFTFSSYETASAATWHYGIPKVLQDTKWRGKRVFMGWGAYSYQKIKFWKTKYYFIEGQDSWLPLKCQWKKNGNIYTIYSHHFAQGLSGPNWLKVKRINAYKLVYKAPSVSPHVAVRVPFN
ncbi:hypothetical protein [Lentilactobacillus parakefiri]|uniref:Uncharacterized protein n=1 Tax=Lentilactobacillus parakefiri TaxID=152332 RepID=A0A224VG44_9LACO|nr:hypothetical protein [Lentilactobacillus parakefiri]TDG91689.1 hypothetical protein C5L28_000261 [Lentilactobacillus parakefiri]GAW72063.1 hypothetical protein LPKJCM_01171 [Lentilactobacillus parakefiri]